MRVAALCTLAFMVLTLLNTIAAKNILQMLLLGIIFTLPPLFDSLKHSLLSWTVLISESRVVENLEDIVNGLTNILALITPGIHNMRNNKLDSSASDLSSDRVEHVGEMILG